MGQKKEISRKVKLMTTEGNHKKLLARIKRAKDIRKKSNIWQDADLSRPEAEQVVREMILSLPAGHYKIHDRKYGTNIVDTMYDIYGWMPSMFVSESMMLGLQALYPEKVYASFTLGLDAIEIKETKKHDIIDIDDYGVERRERDPGRINTPRKGKGRKVARKVKSTRTETQVRGIRLNS